MAKKSGIFKFIFLIKNFIKPIWELFEESSLSKGSIFFILILTVLPSLFEAIFILLLAPFTNSIFNASQIEINNLNLFSGIFKSRFFLLLLIIFVLFTKSTIATFSTYYLTKIRFIIRKNLRIKLIDSDLEASWKTKLEGGKLLEAYLSSATNSSQTFFYFTEVLTYSFYVFAILTTLLIRVSLDLIIVFIFIGSIYYLVIYYLTKSSKVLSFTNLNSNQKLSQLATEVFRGSREIQIFGFKENLLNNMRNEEDKVVKNESKHSFLEKIPSIIPSILITLLVIYGFFSRGLNDIYSSSNIVVTSLVAIQRLGIYLSIIGKKLTIVGAGTAEINFLLKNIKSKQSDRGINLNISKNDRNFISIENLTFNYGNNKQLLKNVNLKFFSGKVAVIAGPSGSGKSSLFSLMLKEYFPISGDIKINNISINKISKYKWYRNLSAVSQTPFMFSTSILNNIKIGKPQALFEDVINASRESGSLEYINKLNNKFEFNVSDGGNNLSGGLRQLISLSRVILKDSPIILLDEPSNNLDDNSINNLKDLLSSWANKNKLVIVITHDQRLIDKRFDIYKVEDFNLLKKENI